MTVWLPYSLSGYGVESRIRIHTETNHSGPMSIVGFDFKRARFGQSRQSDSRRWCHAGQRPRWTAVPSGLQPELPQALELRDPKTSTATAAKAMQKPCATSALAAAKASGHRSIAIDRALIDPRRPGPNQTRRCAMLGVSMAIPGSGGCNRPAAVSSAPLAPHGIRA